MKSVAIEVAQSSHRRGLPSLLCGISHRAMVAALMGLMASFPVRAQSGLPTGGTVVSGGGTISQSGNTLNVNQPGQTGIYNFQTFSIGAGNTVNFNQPNSSASSLARVLGTEASLISGALNAKGSVMLINPNGIAITSTGVINVGSFTASTLNIKDSDFLAGKYKFTGNGGSAGVSNAGRINVSDGGFAALLGGQVSNSGTITARLGKVGLGAGEMITLDFAGDGFLSVAVPSSQLGKLVSADGALVTNSGKIRANGGTVMLSAATAAGVLRDAVNVPGSIRANSVGTHNGKIVIGGGAGGRVNVTGKLAASGINKKKPGKSVAGGVIEVTGADVNLSGSVNVSGTTGGTVNVRSGQGLNVGGSIAATGRTGVAGAVELTGTNISISGGISANGATGGSVIGYATGSLLITGTLEAKGLVARGGAISVTSADVKLVGAKLDASGATGGGKIQIGGGYQGTGSLAHALKVVIDPTTSIRADALGNGDGGTVIVWSDQSTSFAGQISARGGANGGNGGFAEVSGKETLDYTGRVDLRAPLGKFGTLLLDPYNVTISTGADSNQTGFTATGPNSVINVDTLQDQLALSNVVISTGGGVSQDGNITVATPVTWSSGSQLTLDAANAIYINKSISITGGGQLALNASFDITSVPGKSLLNLYFANGASVSFAETAQGSGVGIAGQALTINGESFNLIYSLAAISGFDTSAARRDALALSLTATVIYGGYLDNNIYRGIFEGLGNTISDLKINNSSGGAAVFRTIEPTGTLRNIGITGASVFNNSNGYVGSLVGQNFGVIANVFSSATLNTNTGVGGIAGANYGAGSLIVNSYFTGAINTDVGGGGITGSNEGMILRTFSSGAIRATKGSAGGLVDTNSDFWGNGTIKDSYATGRVTAKLPNGNPAVSGGLTAYNDTNAKIINSYWDVQTTGQTISDGGSKVSAATYGLTTVDFQSGGATGLTGIFGGGTGGLYPYLTSFFPAGVQIITGTVYSNASVTTAPSTNAGAVTVTGLIDGTNIGGTTTGANGYYYLFAADGTISGSGSQVVVYSGGNTSGGATQQQNATGSLSGLDIHGTYLKQQTTGTALSDAANSLATALGANSLPTSYANRRIDITAANFDIDQSINVAGGILTLASTNGGITQSAGSIAAATLNVTTTNQNATLNQSGNTIAAIGSVNLGAGAFTLVTAAAGGFTVSGAAITANGGIDVTNTTGSISTTGSVTASSGAVALTATAVGAGITLGGAITGVGVTLDADAALTINNTIDGGAGTVSLTSATGGITATIGAITAGSLVLSAVNGAATITTAAHNIGTISTNGAVAGLTFAQNRATAVGNVTSTGAVSINAGNSGGQLTVAGAINSNNQNVSLTASSTINVNGDIDAGTGTLSFSGFGASVLQLFSTTITADALSLNLTGGFTNANFNSQTNSIGSISGTASTISVWTNRAISVGASGITAGNTFSLLATGASSDIVVNGAVSAPTVSLTADRDVTINAAVNAGTGGSVRFATGGGSITATGANSAITAGTLEVFTLNGGAVTITTAAHNIGTIKTNDFGSAVGDFTFEQSRASGTTVGILTSSGSISVTERSGAINVTGPVSTQGGEIALRSTNGNLTVGNTITSNGGVIELTAGSSLVAGTLTINATADVTAGNGDIFLAADSMALGAFVSSNSAVTIAPTRTGTAVSLGGNTSGSGLALDQAELGLLFGAPTVTIGKLRDGTTVTAGPIEVGNFFISNSSLNLNSVAGVTQTSAFGTSIGGGIGALTVTAGGTVNLSKGVAVATVSGSTSSGDFVVFGGNSAPNSNLDVGPITTSGGEIVVVNTWGTLKVAGALTSNGGNIFASSRDTLTLDANIDASGSTGGRSIGLFSSAAIIQTGGGLIGDKLLAIICGCGNNDMTLDSATNAISGNVTLVNLSDGNIRFTNSASYAVGGIDTITYASLGPGPSGDFTTATYGSGAGIRTAGAGASVTLTANGDIDITLATGPDDIVATNTLNIARIGASNPNVTLGNTDVFGDPVYVNTIANVGTVDVGEGSFLLYNVGNLNITGAATAASYTIATTGDLTQNVGANIVSSIAAGSIALISGCGCAGGDLTLNANINAGADGIVTLDAGGNLKHQAGTIAGAGIGLSAGADITLNSNIDAGSAGIVYVDAGGNLTQQAGAIRAANVVLLAGGDLTQPGGGIIADSVTASALTVSLNSPTNNFARIEGGSDGDFSATTLGSLTIATSVDSLNGAVTLKAAQDIVLDDGAVSARTTVSLTAGQDIRVVGCGCGGVFGNDVLLSATRDILIDANVRALQTATLLAGRDVTLGPDAFISGDASGDAIVLSSVGKFVNNAGSGVLDASFNGGRWLIYSNNPADNTFGGLDSGNTAIWGATYPTPVTATGNRYVFAETAQLVLSPNDASKIYGDAPAYTFSASGLKSGVANAFAADTLAVILSGSPGFTSTGAALTADVGSYAININTGTAAVTNGYTLSVTGTAQLTVTPATLIFTATPASRPSGQSNPPLSGSITGFKLGQTAATFGGDVWTTLADGSSLAGSYAILGNLLAASPNYIKVQAPGNATALTVTAPIPGNPTSQVTPPSNSPANPGVNITFQNNPTGLANVSFTTGANQRTASTTTDVNTAGNPDAANRTNNGFTYQPISEFDANQYSPIQVPDYADKASLAAIFTMIGRATQPNNARDFMIDGFWTGSDATWAKGSDGKPVANRVTFSDGADKTVSPTETNTNGFPVEAGKTDVLAMLGKGPVILGGSGTPATWLLAIKASDDGKGIIANDPISGRQVLLSYDAGTKTVGGVTGIFDAKTQKFVALSEAAATQQAGEPALKADSLAPLNDFKPATFFAVTVK